MTSEKIDKQVKKDILYMYDFADILNDKATAILNRYFEEKNMVEKIRIAKRIHELRNLLEKARRS